MNAAVFSEDRRHRYTLTRDLVGPLEIERDIAEGDSKHLVFICLNPSTADETKNDPTVTRIIRFGQRWGYSRLVVLNLFAYRSTQPSALYHADVPDLVGPENDRWILDCCRAASMVVAAWGMHGKHLMRGSVVLAKLRREGIPVYALGLTADGLPRHPLYLRADTEPFLLET